MSLNKDYWQPLKDWVNKNALVCWIIAGIVVFAISVVGMILGGTENTKETFKYLFQFSTVILGSGVFTSISRSSLFKSMYRESLSQVLDQPETIGKYEDSLSKILYNDRLLERLSEEALKELWTKVSKRLNPNEHQDLSKEVSELVLKNYIRQKKGYFYKNYRFQLTIEKFHEGYLYMKEIVSYQVFPKSLNEKIILKNSKVADVPKASQKSKIEVSKLRINNKNFLKKEPVTVALPEFSKDDYEEIGDSRTFVGKVIEIPINNLNLENKESYYEVDTEYDIILPIESGFLKTFRTTTLTKSLDIIIQFGACSQELDVDFQELGTLKQFRPQIDKKYGMITLNFTNGILLNNQGFLINVNQR